MPKLSFGFLLACVALGLTTTAVSCSDPVDGCEYTGTCTGSGGKGGDGSGGAGAEGGAAGNGGTGGTGGSSGSSGSGAGGGGADGGGAGGSAGASGGAGGDAGNGNGAGGAGAEGGVGGEAGNGGAGGSGGGTCDETLSPSEAECLVDDAYAIFVAPSGRDQNQGGRNLPVKTIAKALALAGTDKFVIACAATFPEIVTLTGGAKLYGGFACPSENAPWTYDATKKTVVAPTVEGAALEIRDVAESVVIEDVEFAALDGGTAGASSVAAFVVGSDDVTLRRVALTAGKGVGGVDATNAGFVFPVVTELVGNDGEANDGGRTKVCTCPEEEPGSKGGAGGATPDGGGGSGTPPHDTTSGKSGDISKSCSSGGSGLDGASAPDAAPDADGAKTTGSLSTFGWTPSDGIDATNGVPGQGGGGGVAKPGGGGGSGGCGGCGGKGGPAGTGGGASIALLSLNSSIALEACELSTSDAGDGGDGAAGQVGQVTAGGGGNGFGSGSDKGCAGGSGGKGSAGGAGGGAAGGLSVGIVYQGGTIDRGPDTAITPGTAGSAGRGGKPGTNDGVAGVADEELELP